VENRKGCPIADRALPGRASEKRGVPARNEFEQYVVRYGVFPTPCERDLVCARRRAARDPMIRHDMSTCILCTRCVRAARTSRWSGVLTWGSGGDTEIIVGATATRQGGCTWCGECVRVCDGPISK